MATAAIDLEDFTCSICREIFENPVSLSCLHCYCQECLVGLRKQPASPLPSSDKSSMQPLTLLTQGSVIYRPTFYEPNQSFVCAMCRAESFGYTDCRDITADLKTLEGLCLHCRKNFMLCDLRKHLEICPSKPKVGVNDILKTFNEEFFTKLSQPQAEAYRRARSGKNRSTFQCPYCTKANFTVELLCEHIEETHLDDDHRRICTICASMPWGDNTRVSSNIYEHIYNRHRFNYEIYVNYDQDEESMVAEAVERSMMFH
ncbi:unnamed protein product [Rotaria magnacalcarata]|uniref:RING-type domain-containing protein n=4 Tax=Rotaria magnacalcarata TaxID=392030 RepID=A0A816LW75_9BILA|nr:unnamed protein product [Rotaria magnacalcarata]CAF3856511.1 unnamed protein product [Rotaria magnacalcarata]